MAKLGDTIIEGILKVIGNVRLQHLEAEDLAVDTTIKENGVLLSNKYLGYSELVKGTTTGTSSAYIFTKLGFTAVNASIIVLNLHVSNEKGATLNVNSTGAKPIVDSKGDPITKGFLSNTYITLVYNGTQFVIQGGGAGSGTGGLIIGGTDLDSLSINIDTAAMNTVKTIASSTSSSTDYATTLFEDLHYGTYSIMIRLKSSKITETSNFICIQAYHSYNTTDVLLNTAYIKQTDFSLADTFDTFGFITNFKGSNAQSNPILKIKISLLASISATNVTVDYVLLSPTYTSIVCLPTV